MNDRKFFIKISVAAVIDISIVLIFAVLLSLLFSGCGNKNNKIDVSEMSDKSYSSNGELIVPKGYIAFEVYGKDKELILDSVLIKYKDNLSVADISKGACKYKNIPISFSGIGTMVYVQGINNLFEFDNGPESGWLYCVNGEFQGTSSGSLIAKDGDCVQWFYTLDLGKDIGADKVTK